MWRAYGGRAAAALVFGGGMIGNMSADVGVTLSPIAYLNETGTEEFLSEVVENIRINEEYLKEASKQQDAIKNVVYQMLRSALHSIKHPGFQEEREWRLFHTPNLDASSWARISVETVGGIPQKICKLSLKNSPENGVSGISIPEILQRVIIGPTSFGWSIREAFVMTMYGLGIVDAHDRVVVSEIPLRG